MTKKRTAAEANKDEQTNKGSDSVLQNEDNAKRAKLTPLSDKTLQDLPIHLLERILIKVVSMEVKGMKLAKSVWKEKADRVISRLKNVCLSWSGILTTNGFLNEVHRILDGTAQETIRLEIFQEAWYTFQILKVTILKDEIFLIFYNDDKDDQGKVSVYDRNNMVEVKDAIALPEKCPLDIEACNVSNCVYVLCLNMEWKCPSILRITKDEEHQFNILPWINDLRLPVSTLTAAPNGQLAVTHGQDPVVVSIYNANGSLMMSADIYGFQQIDSVIQKSNGNLVLSSVNGDYLERVLTEINTDGKIQRQYVSSLDEGSSVSFADRHGRILISKPSTGMELLDSEFNVLDLAGQPPDESMFLYAVFYNSERNEVLSQCNFDTGVSLLSIFRISED